MTQRQIVSLLIVTASLIGAGAIFVEGIVGPFVDLFETLPQVAWFYVWTTASYIAISLILFFGFGLARDISSS